MNSSIYQDMEAFCIIPSAKYCYLGSLLTMYLHTGLEYHDSTSGGGFEEYTEDHECWVLGRGSAAPLTSSVQVYVGS